VDYRLKNGNAVIVVSDVGATIKMFQIDGENIFFPYFVGKDKKARGGCPICSPYFGLMQEFNEKRHGYLRDIKATNIVERGPNAMEFVFNFSGTSKYPWSLFHEVRVETMRRGLFLRLTIVRLDDGLFDLAYVNPGFHPYFSGWAEDARVTSGSGEYSGFYESAKIFATGSSALVIENSKKRIAMKLEGDFSPKKSHAVLWSDAPEKYFCVEPIFTDPKNGMRLGMGESVEISMNISLF